MDSPSEIESKSVAKVDSMEPKSVADEVTEAGESVQAGEDTGSNSGSVVETILEVAPSTPIYDRSTVSSPTFADGRDGLRRTTPRIASLKATFERAGSEGPTNSPKRFGKSKSPSNSIDHDLEVAKTRDDEIAKLKRQLEQERELKHALEDKCSALEEDAERLEAKLAQHNGDWQAEIDRQSKKLVTERDRAQDAFIEIKRQLLGLKRSISTATRTDSQYADFSFTAEMQNLYHEIQNWVVNTFRRVKMERTAAEMTTCLEKVVEPKHLEHLRPLFQDWDPNLKIAALQAVVACYLMEVWTEPLLFGLPVWRKGVKRATETMSTILPSHAYVQWRSSTLDAIKQQADIKDSVDSAAKALSEMICISLTSLTGAEESAAMTSSLKIMVKRIISLSHVFAVQRSRYHFILPLPGSPFDSSRMDDTSLDTNPLPKTITCASFPLVLKVDHTSEDDDASTSVVVKAKVVCHS